MQENDDFMSGRNQRKGNGIAMVIGLLLLTALIIVYVIMG
jgi:hypothetical protein